MTARQQWHMLPPELAAAPRWHVWREEPSADPTKKPRKVPYYVSGGRREGALGAPADLAKLVTHAEAVAAWQLMPEAYAGVGFALGGGWQGIDLDDVTAHGLADLWQE